MSKPIDPSKFVDQKINAYKLQLARLLTKPLDNLLDESIICYKTPKNPNETNDSYGLRVTKCTQEWQKRFDLAQERIVKYRTTLDDRESSHQAKLANCVNIVSETEIKDCEKVESERYANELKHLYAQIVKEQK